MRVNTGSSVAATALILSLLTHKTTCQGGREVGDLFLSGRRGVLGGLLRTVVWCIPSDLSGNVPKPFTIRRVVVEYNQKSSLLDEFLS